MLLCGTQISQISDQSAVGTSRCSHGKYQSGNCELATAIAVRPVVLSMFNITTLPEDARTHLCAIPTSAPAERLSDLQHAKPPTNVS